MRFTYTFFVILFLSIIMILPGCTKKVDTPVTVKIMSFNIWIGGGKSIGATAEVFVKSEADIIGIQESTRDNKNIAVHIADSLGWYSFPINDTRTIVSKYPIVDTAKNKNGVKIQLGDKRFVWMFDVHLMYCPYEPYQLNGIEYCGGPLLHTAEEAILSATNTRSEEVNSTIADIMDAQKEGSPVFLVGDFNEPSCMDWTERAAKAGLCKMAVAWPSTKAFIEKVNMKDSYRVLYPDEVKNPGHTWTSIPVKEGQREVFDRIDFVFFWGDQVKPVSSQIIGEVGQSSDIQFENYPSDHRSVISTFSMP